MAGLRMSPSSPPVQIRARCEHPRVVPRDGPGALGRLVVGMGVHGQDAELVVHGWSGYRRGGDCRSGPPMLGSKTSRERIWE